MRCVRTAKRSGKTSSETRFYLSCQEPKERSIEGWLALIQGHWAGVEIRNHWKRDAIWGEDRTRSRNPNILANLALLRSALLSPLGHHYPHTSLPQIHESFARYPHLAFRLVKARS